jgi:putative endopeptidase
VAATSEYLGFLLGHIYVLKTFPPDGKTQALDLIHNLEASFRENMQHLNWMDDATRTKSIQKLDKISNMIGYPDKWPTYEKLLIEKDKYFASAMTIRLVDIIHFSYSQPLLEKLKRKSN